MIRILHLKLKVFEIITFFAFIINVNGQGNRTIDGTGNNLLHQHWGAVGTNQLQIITNGYSDGISEPSGINRPNPRMISNAVFNQEGLLPDVMGLSDVAWVWGQFIDHDITLVTDDAKEHLDISIPSGDPYFDPYGTGKVSIGMSRSAYDPQTGTSRSNPRAFPNHITAFVDASTVYGSDGIKEKWLRTFEKGKLKMSEGNLLPYNTTTGEYNAPIDPQSPEMAMPFPGTKKWFVAGDVRANENPLLTSFHTLFAREHNRLCDELKAGNPSWTDEQLYQRARKIVGGIIQAIVYEEWLPTMGVHLDIYTNYKPNLEVGIMNVFSAAAYRYGHTVINGKLIRMDNEGNTIPQGNVLLRDAFFNPNTFVEGGGVDPLLNGMVSQIEQDFDCKMVHDLRNFLFGPPGSGGLDLASLNINRGRERGLPDYNTIRKDIGLSAIQSFSTFTKNAWLNGVLQNLYGDINNIDPWVGFLAEDHMSSALFGESVMAIMTKQFTMLRDGDRFYYESDKELSKGEVEAIKNTRLVDIMRRNSNATNLQEKVFLAGTVTNVSHVDQHAFELQVYPNPASGEFFINIAAHKSGEGTTRIIDMLGHLIEERKTYLNEGMNTISFNLNNVPDGLYNVTLTMDQKTGHQKIIKSNR